ncbi:uncharacterized protein LOC127847497 [Dreissena polymorpha]|uniref:Uncharacterized protein n=1 Tax=Dreissena polymorpha TaxID=45954 RepID=A0A9D4S3P9_DREPO|nr:uncharacterized protein LOC127847497 [Dreissena polymorpha]XP_052235466.1 uncharacterized protein LOC127847497 [Dreissena polymorpha]KAH3888767.1 hypothetical protein DPMN_012807 [Dreissena polymorpha]
MATGMNGQRLTDDICRSVLSRAHKKIIDVMNADTVLDKLRDIKFLSHEDYNAIRKVVDKSTKNRSLVCKISQSGKRAYCDFKKILKETGQNVIIQELESKEKELGIETAENSAQSVQRIISIVRDSAPERMETDQRVEPPSRTLQPTVQNSLDDLNRSRTVTVVKTIKKDLQDGRLIELDNKTIQYLKEVSSTDDTLVGGFGRVYKSKEPVKGFGIRVVLKEIDMERRTGNQSATQIIGSVTNEKIASRLMHFGIVPVLAYHDDLTHGKYYLLSPYLVNGDLFQAIASDRRSCLENKKNDIRLKWNIRIKIMYHIACAIDFMHSGNEFRGPVLHMDIKSKNIVLDSQFNARLIDFGIARELKEDAETLLVTSTNYGTPGYYSTVPQIVVKKQNDYHNFGVVLLELITGLERSAKVEGIELRKWHVNLIYEKRQVLVWHVDKVVKNVAEIAVKCIESVTANSSITSEEIKKTFKNMCRKHEAVWDAIQADQCEICLVNEEMKVGFDGHDTGSEEQVLCSKRIRICCSCMRNSYINPVQCHTCGETIKPFINANWGAILAAGYDEVAGNILRKDIERFKDMITSKVLPAMCLNPKNVITSTKDMKDKNAYLPIEQAFDELSKRDIETLLFVYSGHHGESGLQVGADVFYPLDKISEKLNKWHEENPKLRKVIVLLDCCCPKKLNLNTSLTLIQFNATSPTTTANLNKTDGSPFLMDVIQALTGRANGKGCKHEECKCSDHLHDKFITLNDLWMYLNEHIKQGHLSGENPYMKADKPNMNAVNVELKDTILAYNYDFEVKFKFTIEWLETEVNVHVLPGEFNDLKPLKLILADKILKHIYDIGPVCSDVLTKFSEIISVEINTGPRTKHVQEIDTIELLLLSWNSKRLLRCLARLLPNVNVDKPVGRCLKDVPDIRNIHLDVLQKCNMTGHQLTRSNLTKYKTTLQKKTKNTEKYNEFIFAVDMIINHAATQLQDTRLDISFFDLPKGYTLVHMNLIETTGNQEGAMQ